ncbi:MAG: STAS/SEC14 domain-containing protein, partial [Proteobacteria bacterium]|nr:STAS/SEC14 domain-containing protein [Pseudomonadota bacterium]
MIQIKLDKDAGVVTVTPSVPLNEQDFALLASEVDPYIEKEGKL